MPLLRWTRKFHLSLGCVDDDAPLIETRWHGIRIKNRFHGLDVSYCDEYSLVSGSIETLSNLPLLALDSETFDEPGSAELQ